MLMDPKRAGGKILPLKDLAATLDGLRPHTRIVHCHGVFDLLHIGHIRHFEEARGLGDVLVVTVTPDVYVNKGPHRPAFTEQLRAEAVAALACVDYVAVNAWPTAVETIGLLKPHVYVKGREYRNAAKDPTGKIADEERAVRENGGEIVFTEDITFSSSTLINRYFSPFPEPVRDYLADFSARHDPDEVLDWLNKARTLRVLTLGEAIVDEYHYCEVLGKSGKEPILAARYSDSERFAGGVLAVANHVAAITDQVDLVTFLGEVDSHEDFIRRNLRPAVRPRFLVQKGAPTLVKRRFVENYPFQKLFEVYIMNGGEECPEKSRLLRAELEGLLPLADVVVVADYGHGMIDRETVDLLCGKAKFLAVNVQMNAGNHGFNTVSKYPRADFVCISEKELRLEARSRSRPLPDIMAQVAGRLSCDKMLITQGRQGCSCYDARQGYSSVPAFTGHIVDRIGTGDSVLSVASLLAAVGAPMEVTGFIGNAVGAQTVATVCNRDPLDRVSLAKHLISLMK